MICKVISKLIFFALCLTQCSCSIVYVAKAGYHQTKLLLARQDSSSLLVNEQTTPLIKEKITLTNNILPFAKQIGLTTNENYQTYSDYVFPEMWVVTAAPKLSLDPHTWWFPVVGTVPYKGFFTKEDALEEIASLKSMELDVSLRTASAFSTLGWFDDPITDSLINLTANEFIITLLHELLHVTVWVNNEVTFNETLANAFSYLAAIEYCQTRELSCESYMKNSLEKQLLITKELEHTRDMLMGVFQDETLTTQDKLKRKEELFENLRKKMYPRSETITSENEPHEINLNNASFVGLYTYYKDFDKIILFLKKQPNLKESINLLKRSVEDGTELKKLICE